jgi:hypothetical protein
MAELFRGVEVNEKIQGNEPQEGDPGYQTWSKLHERVQECAWETVEACIARLSAIGIDRDLTLRSIAPEFQAVFKAHCKKLQAYEDRKIARRAVAFGRYMHIHLNADHTRIIFTLIYEPHYEKCHKDDHIDHIESVWAANLQIILRCGIELEQTPQGAALAEAESEIAITITQKSCSVHSKSTNFLMTDETLKPSDLLAMSMAPASTCDSRTTA